MMQTFVMGNGGLIPIGSGGGGSFASDCGRDFDQYNLSAVSGSFPYDPRGPAHREIKELWNGRRLRFYTNNKWREAKVVSWEQSNSGPYSPSTFWHLNLICDTVGIKDKVEIHGLQSSTKFNGKWGEIFGKTDQGRYKVDCGSDVIAVKPENLKPTARRFQVNRMNIDGGGTLLTDDDSLISLEWLEPASPSIDLDVGTAKANCPMCRQAEIPTKDNDEAVDDECPMCLETKTCRMLECGHFICNDCWEPWCSSPSTFPIRRPDIDDLQTERAKRQEEFLAIAPPLLGGNGDTDTTKFEEYVERGFKKLVCHLNRDGGTGARAVRAFWKEALLMPPLVFQKSWQSIALQCPTPLPLDILVKVLEERKDEMLTAIESRTDVPDAQCAEAINQGNIGLACCRLGEICEEVGNIRGSIPYYEESLRTNKHLYDVMPSWSYGEPPVGRVAKCYMNLGLALKRLGRLTEAMENYNASARVKILPNSPLQQNQDKLRKEMKQWTGSSGSLTPGC